MMLRNMLAALIALLLLIAPWVLGFTDISHAIKTSLLLGSAQFFSSMLAGERGGWDSWPNWISFVCSVGFILFPFAYDLAWLPCLTYVVLGMSP